MKIEWTTGAWLVSWLLLVILAFIAGFFGGRSYEKSKQETNINIPSHGQAIPSSNPPLLAFTGCLAVAHLKQGKTRMKLSIMAIPLTQGLFALVDGEDYEQLSKHKWYAKKNRNTFYAVRMIYKPKKTILMHRVIMNAQPREEIDHRTRYGLDNRKTNLRFCTHAQNLQNQQSQNGTSKYKGVCWHNRDKKWHTQIKHNGKNIHIGYFNNEIEAAKAYDRKAKELFGDFAYLNFPRMAMGQGCPIFARARMARSQGRPLRFEK